MSTNIGVACECKTCRVPQWYDHGVCQACGTNQSIEFTWVANSCKGGIPSTAPTKELHLESGACVQLVDIWTNWVLVRGLSPYLTPEGRAVKQYSSPPWYVERGVDVAVQFTMPTDSGFTQRLNRASARMNQSFLVQVMAIFEAFAGGKPNGKFWLPNNPSMREFHHARRLRNKIAHGDRLTDHRLVGEAQQLFGPKAVVDGCCTLDISLVLEPLWARLLLYACSLEEGLVLPPKPAVVVAVNDAGFTAQTFDGILERPSTVVHRRIGDVISLSELA